jgi:hypothetical protein
VLTLLTLPLLLLVRPAKSAVVDEDTQYLGVE